MHIYLVIRVAVAVVKPMWNGVCGVRLIAGLACGKGVRAKRKT